MKNCSQLQIYMENAVFHAILSVVDNEGKLDDAKEIMIITHAHTQLQGVFHGWRLSVMLCCSMTQHNWVMRWKQEEHPGREF